jgi:hypothetical protein
MGYEIHYCSVCQKQIRSQEVQSGKAFKLDDRIFCLSCGPDLLKNLPKDRVKEIFTTLAAPAPTAVAAGAPSAASTARIIAARSARPGRPAKSGTLIGVGIAGTALLGIMVWMISSSGGPGPEPASVPAAARPAVRPAPAPLPHPVPPSPPAPATAPIPSSSPGPATKEQTAQQALNRAREFAAAHPTDFDPSIREYQEACFVTTGTSLQEDAKKELEKLRGKQREFFASELASLEGDIGAALKEERFMKGIELLGIAKDRHASTEWKLLVGKRIRDISDSAFQRLNTVKQEALEAKGRGDASRVDALRAKVASWGIPELIKEFREAVDE